MAKITDELVEFVGKHTEKIDNPFHKGLIAGGIYSGALWALNQAEEEWIPADERDPEPFQSVICTLQNGHVMELAFAPQTGYFTAISSVDVPATNPVIAWKPLPAPYKPKEK